MLGSKQRIHHKQISAIYLFIIVVVIYFRSSKPGFVGYMRRKRLKEGSTVWVLLGGQVSTHRQPVTTHRVSVPLLKSRSPKLNLRGLSTLGWDKLSPDSETPCQWGRRSQETTANHFRCSPSPFFPDLIHLAIIKHLLVPGSMYSSSNP